MHLFLILLIAGFGFNLASTFTSFYSLRWGRKTGTFVTILLRDILGIPVWAAGFLFAIREEGDLFFRASFFATTAGWILIAAGAVIIIAALASIRIKAAAPSEGDSLVNTGMYSLIRHPIHCGTFLEFAGLFILWPTLNVAIAFAAGIIWIWLQSKLEERDLVKRIPGYSEYMSRVPGFIPFLKR